MAKKSKGTPLRKKLEENSFLQSEIRDGLSALDRSHERYVALDLKNDIADTLNLDESLRKSFPRKARWDYLLGYTKQESLLALEVHPVRDSEVSSVIEKKRESEIQLRGHLKNGARVSGWYLVWERNQFSRAGKQTKRLAQSGIIFSGKSLTAKVVSL